MSQSQHEKALLNAAERIEGTLATFRDAIATMQEKVDAAVAAAAKPTAVDVENLDDEFDTLNQALNDMEKTASSLRGSATQAGNAPSGSEDASNIGEGTAPPTQKTGTPETGPAGVATTPLTIPGDEFQTSESGESASTLDGPQESPGKDSGGVTPLGQEPATASEESGNE